MRQRPLDCERLASISRGPVGARTGQVESNGAEDEGKAMKIFRLEPVQEHLSDPRWETSTKRKTCWVAATTEEQARDKVRDETYIAARRKEVGGLILTSPWHDPTLTTCQVDDTAKGKTGDDGKPVFE